MRILLLCTLFCTASTWAQETVNRTIRLSHTDTPQAIQELATIVRSIGEISQLSADATTQSITLSGSAAQINQAEWIIARLDDAPRAAGKQEYRMPGGGGENAVRLFSFQNVTQVQQLQELATVVRAILEIRRVFTYPSRNVLAIRGTEAQLTAADWLVANLDQPAAPGGTLQMRMPEAGEEDMLRVFPLAHANSPQRLQETATMVRSITEIRRLFTYNALRIIAVRGTAGQLAMAEWLIDSSDRAARPESGRFEYRTMGGGDDLARMFYLSNAENPARLQEIAAQVRNQFLIRQMFTFAPLNAISMRGTSAQAQAAEKRIAEVDR